MTPAAGPLAARIAVPERLDPGLLKGFDCDARVVGLSGDTMGTRWNVRLALPKGRDLAPIGSAIEQRLVELVDQMSHWEPGSILSRYNRASAGSWVAIPPDFATVMRTGLEVAKASRGAFDPTLGRLTDLWGLGPNPAASRPSEDDLRRARAASGWQRVAVDPAAPARLFQPGGLWLDLSGIAKGHAADAIADLLAAMALPHALVEIGGECVGRGIKPDGEPWWVDCETPSGIDLPPLRVALHGLALATSGDYLRGAHTLDPVTGCPAIHDVTAVSVLHKRCAFADAWASALSALEPTTARSVAEYEGIAARIVGREGEEWLSPALAAML